MGQFYISAPVDEVRLAEQVAPLVAALAGELPDRAALHSLTQSGSNDLATMLLYRAIRASPRHARFMQALEQEAVSTSHAPVNAKVLIIPALFHGHYPETGADAEFAAAIARTCGFAAARIPTKSLGTIRDNAAIIHAALEAETAEKIWIFSVSKGSGEFRTFLQLYPDSPAIGKIAGWINACGLPRGSQIADVNSATAWTRLKYRTICRLLGTRFEMVRELRTDHAYWQQPLQLPTHMQVFNFCAIPLGSHIQTSLISRYLALQALGPNDGMVLCRDSIIEQGLIYPVWGCDHFFRSPLVVPLLYRFFSFLRRQ